MEKLYREVLVQDPGNAVAMADLASTLALHGFNYLQTGDPLQDSLVAEAQELALRAKALDPNLPGIYIALSIHAGLHNDLDGSRRMLEERLARDPKNPSAYINLASVRIFAGEPQQALDLLKQALALYPRGSTALFTNMADDSLMLGDNDAVIGWAQKALDIDAGFFASHAQLAMAYANKGDTAKAQAACRRIQTPDTGGRRQDGHRRAGAAGGPVAGLQPVLPDALRAAVEDCRPALKAPTAGA